MNSQHAPTVIPMTEAFDPYRKWLGIPPKDQPPNHYRLLGIAHFEDDPDVIENAATRQMAHVRTYQSGKHSADSQRILNELTAAKLCLLQAEKKRVYDDRLRAKLSAEGKLSSDNLLVSSEVMEEPPEEPPREEFPELRLSSNRWKTDSDDSASAEPPIVPIPMPQGMSIAAPPRLSPSLPLSPTPLLVTGSSRSSYRSKKSASAALPIAIAVVTLVLLLGGGVTAVVLSGVLSKPAEKQHKKAAVTPTNFPLGTSAKEKKEATADTNPKPVPLPEKKPVPEGSSVANPRPELPKKKPSDRGAIEDELRQALFLGRQALEQRQADSCKTYVVTAENTLDAHPEVDSQLKEQVRILRELHTLSEQFWSLVRDAAINGKVPAGEKLRFHRQDFVLVSHEGDQVTYKMGDKEETHSLIEMDAKMALALAFHSTKEDPAKRLSLLAFCMTDKNAGGDRGWTKNFYTRLALSGHTNALLARELGVAEKPDPATTKVPEDEDMPAKDKPATDKPAEKKPEAT